MNRNPLFKRTKLMGLDIVDALSNLVKAGGSLPLAVTKAQVTNELVNIACTRESNGIVQVLDLPAAAEKFMFDNFLNSLMTSTVFSSGYAKFEEVTKFPVVPVTSYFFNHVYDDEARDCLDAMTNVDIRQSLPKRPSVPVDNDGVPIESDNGDAAFSGWTAGVVIFPRNSKARLMKAWHGRVAAMAIGHNNGMMGRIEHAHPNDGRVPVLEEKVTTANKGIRRLAPPVKLAREPLERER